MPRETYDLSCVSFSTVMDFCEEKARRFPRYAPALEHVTDEYFKARRKQLRFNRRTWITRDRDGIISQPAGGQWDEATHEDALHELCREIWCNSVRQHNLATA